jgi:hypothetical protein
MSVRRHLSLSIIAKRFERDSISRRETCVLTAEGWQRERGVEERSDENPRSTFRNPFTREGWMKDSFARLVP